MSLKLILRTNALSCLTFGLFFVAFPESIGRFLSDDPVQPWLLLGLGAMLVANGALLFATSFQTLPMKELIIFFSAGDFAWVLGTLGLILADVAVTSPLGVASALAVTCLVGGLGAAQLFMRKQMGHC